MIAIDTSSLVAIFRGEAEAERMAASITDADAVLLSAGNFLEATMVLSSVRFASDADQWLETFVVREGVVIVPVSEAQANIARAAFRRFGKGTGHGASLNFGDCFAYALAKSLDVPLLYKGDDFARTDVRSALA